MGTNKRIKVGKSDIGTGGNPGKGNTSAGSQFPFLPSEDTYKNANLGKKSGGGSGTTNSSSQYNFPFLPKGNASGIRGGKK